LNNQNSFNTNQQVNVQRAKYNADHGFTAWKFFVVVTADGHICFVSRVVGGSESDKTHCNESCFPDMLERSMDEGGRRRMGMGRSQLGRRERGRREGGRRERERRISLSWGETKLIEV
jgi:hypothetical protein